MSGTYRTKGGVGMKRIVISVLVLVLMVLVLNGCEDTFQPTPKPEHSDASAWIMAEKFIEKRLKAPSTAKYSGVTKTKITDLGGGKYKVEGYVDAHNSFGAMIRNNYVCVLHYAGNQEWILDSLDLKE
jgi:hypothetical protein